MKEIEFVKQRITELRVDKRMSERELSRSVGKSANYIRETVDLRKPDGGPSLKMFFKICAALGVEAKAFFDTENPHPLETEAITAEMLRLTGGDREMLAMTLETLCRMTPELFCALVAFCNQKAATA